MMNQVNAEAGCHIVGEYIDEAELPQGISCGNGEPVRPRVLAEYVDLWAQDGETKEFTVLLKDGGIVGVRGHGLKHLPAVVAGESGSYGVIVRTGGEELTVALFKVTDVVGIFHGELRSGRKIA